LDGLDNIEIGTVYKKGNKIALLGDSAVNGDYSPICIFKL
jgi:hypothetical protein